MFLNTGVHFKTPCSVITNSWKSHKCTVFPFYFGLHLSHDRMTLSITFISEHFIAFHVVRVHSFYTLKVVKMYATFY